MLSTYHRIGEITRFEWKSKSPGKERRLVWSFTLHIHLWSDISIPAACKRQLLCTYATDTERKTRSFDGSSSLRLSFTFIAESYSKV